MANINDTYFDGYYKDIWRSIIPDELTMKEVDFMIPYFNLKEGSKVLDLMCGYGRHAVGLAKKGIEVTAVDNLDSYVNEIKKIVAEEHLSIKAIRADVIEYKPEIQYDLVMCMGNSFNFFNEADALKLLGTVSTSLLKGGHLLINSWSIAEIALPNYKGKSWSHIGGSKFLIDPCLFFHPTRIEAESTIITEDGKTEIKRGIDYIYSINEMESMLKQSGFSLKEVYSIPGRKKFTLGEPRAYFIAEKI